jgi:hypothetical protein
MSFHVIPLTLMPHTRDFQTWRVPLQLGPELGFAASGPIVLYDQGRGQGGDNDQQHQGADPDPFHGTVWKTSLGSTVRDLHSFLHPAKARRSIIHQGQSAGSTEQSIQ